MAGDEWREEIRGLRAEMQQNFREQRAEQRADMEELKEYIGEHVLKPQKEHERRVRSLENWRNYVTGAAALIGLFVGRLWDSWTGR